MDRIKKMDDEGFDYESYFSLCITDVLIDKGYSGIKKEFLNDGNCCGCGRLIDENTAFCVETKCEIGSKWVYPKFSIYCEKCSWGE